MCTEGTEETLRDPEVGIDGTDETSRDHEVTLNSRYIYILVKKNTKFFQCFHIKR